MRHKKLHPCFCKNFAKLCSTLIIFNRQEDTLINFPSPACLIFFVKSKTGNQLKIYYCLRILVADTVHVKPLSCCNVRFQTSSLQTCGLLIVPTLVLWITGYWEYCRNVFIRSLLRTCMSWSCACMIEAWSGIQQSVIDQAIDQWRIRLNACVKSKGKRFEHMLCVVLIHNCWTTAFTIKPIRRSSVSAFPQYNTQQGNAMLVTILHCEA